MIKAPIVRLLPQIKLPYKEIMARLGYRSSKTVMSSADEARINSAINDAFSLCELSSYFRKIAITGRGDSSILIETGNEILSESFSVFTGGSGSLLVMAASAGKGITDQIAALVETQRMGLAVIFDAVASECADSALDWTQRYCSQLLKRSAERVSDNRFSPGYGDLNIETQRIFFDILALDKYGFTLTPSSLLIPEKSVIGIAAVA